MTPTLWVFVGDFADKKVFIVCANCPT